jgi:hypothetical protein
VLLWLHLEQISYCCGVGSSVEYRFPWEKTDINAKPPLYTHRKFPQGVRYRKDARRRRISAVLHAAVGVCEGSDTGVVRTPGEDALLDRFGVEVFGEGAGDERGQLGVGGEAQGDELLGGEFVGVGCGCERGDAQAFFKTDDTILYLQRVGSEFDHDKGEEEGDENPSEIEVSLERPTAAGAVDGEAKIDERERHEDEVVEGIPRDMARGRLSFRHGGDHTRACVSLEEWQWRRSE